MKTNYLRDTLIGIALIILIMTLNAGVLKQLWEWFIYRTVVDYKITFWQAMGITWIIEYLKIGVNRKETINTMGLFYRKVVEKVIALFFTLLIGFIIFLFI